MLRYYGHDDAYVIAGGFPAWTAAGISADDRQVRSSRRRRSRRARARSCARRATKCSRSPKAAARAAGRNAARQTYAQRDRDIKGAVRICGNDCCSKTRAADASPIAATLDRWWAEAALDRNARTIVSCGSGVSASGAWLALREAGFDDVAVYDGSWMEWEHDALPSVPKPTP
jgi:thiosulfate/3-mercaptopyruvate sulfurtransferase